MISYRPVVVIAVGLISASAPALAVDQPGHLVGQPELEVASGPAARVQPALAWNVTSRVAPVAWRAFSDAVGGSWQTLWDVDTGVPTRIYGPGIPMPGSVASAEKAETYARGFLAQHIDLLAPGSDPRDFRVVSNHFDGAIRTIGMYQFHAGMRVLSGQVSFRFKNDQLYVIGSEALPNIDAPTVVASVRTALFTDAAQSWIGADARHSRVMAVDGPYVLPIISPGAVSYRTVMRVDVETQEPVGQWQVYADANTGELVAREQELRFTNGTVYYNVPDRYPIAGRTQLPASSAEILVAGTPTISTSDGAISWADDVPIEITTQPLGPLVRVYNEAGDVSTASFLLEPQKTATWDVRDDEQVDAQVTTFIYSNLVKDYVRSFAPKLGYLDLQLEARVNIDAECNAFSDGFTINFFLASDRCANTGRLADVIYHEFGHVLHRQSIIEGVGAFDGAFSEGLSDYLANTINNDPGMAPGFFFNDTPLRQSDPKDFEHRWPDDIAEIHYTGIIFAGAMWDLRQALIDKYDYDEGVAIADRLYFAAVQRATSIPTTYVEILAADDDDGNLDNGTPHECLINEIFGRQHGLRDISVEHTPLSAQPPERDGYAIRTQVTGISDRCAGDRVESVKLHWGLRSGGLHYIGDITENVIDMTARDDGSYIATIPQQAAGEVVQYQVVFQLADGGEWRFPDNRASSVYEFYVGDLVPLYCTDFETDPYAEGWVHGLSGGEAGNGADDWQWATPMGQGGDPSAAFSGSKVIGNDLGGEGYNGEYQPDKINFTLSPSIYVGDYSDVHVQYRRWLTVEDSLYDRAIVYANDQEVWRNLDTDHGKLHHLDGEWMFHDLPVSQFIDRSSKLQVKFELTSDPGLEFGGWTIDDFCVVARPDSICGDGQVTGAEECDDGTANSDTDVDACRIHCRRHTCGDGVLDSDEMCDDGNLADDDGCTQECLLPATESSGCGIGLRPRSPVQVFAAAVMLLLWSRRRRRRS